MNASLTQLLHNIHILHTVNLSVLEIKFFLVFGSLHYEDEEDKETYEVYEVFFIVYVVM